MSGASARQFQKKAISEDGPKTNKKAQEGAIYRAPATDRYDKKAGGAPRFAEVPSGDAFPGVWKERAGEPVKRAKDSVADEFEFLTHGVTNKEIQTPT